MKKKTAVPMARTRKVFCGCILLLAAAGFLTDWLVYGNEIAGALESGFLPMVLPALVLLWEKERHFLEHFWDSIRDAKLLNAALPMLLGSLGLLYRGRDTVLSTYFALSFLLCICVSEATLQRRLDEAVSAMLVHVAVFYTLAVLAGDSGGGAIAIMGMSYFFFLRIVLTHSDSHRHSAAFCKSLLALTAVIVFLSLGVVDVLELVLDSWQPDSPVGRAGLAFQELWEQGRWFGAAGLDSSSLQALRSGFPLGYLAARFGWAVLVPVLGTVLVMLLAAMRLSFSTPRKLTVLPVGCFCLLVMGVLSGLAPAVGLDLGMGEGLPFFRGGFFRQLYFYLLAAGMLHPINPPGLEELDGMEDCPDFPAMEAEALALLPRKNLDSLARLCRYVYDHPERVEAWKVLFRDFLDCMDSNSLRIMVLNGDKIFRTTWFRDTWPLFFRYAADPETEVPEELQTVCHNNSFQIADLPRFIRGTRLTALACPEETALVPPFFRSIGPEACRDRNLKAVSIPHTVRRICLSAFEGCESLERAELRQGLEEIGPFAFAATALKEAALPEGLRLVEEQAFAGTALTSLFVPGSLEEISGGAFSDIPGLKLAVLYEGVRSIGSGAFRNCGALEQIHIPDSLTHMEEDAFDGCPGLQVWASEEWKARYPDLLRILTKEE